MPAPSPAPSPTVTTERLGLRTRRGRVFTDVTFVAEIDRVTALLGATGSGKTALLLTLAGRMRATEGTGTVCGHDLGRETARVRRAVGLGLVGGVNDLDDSLTAGQHAREALLFRGARRDTPRSVLARVGLAERERTHVRDLDIEQRELLGIALGLVGEPKVLVVDDIDHDLDVAQQGRVMALLRSIAADGVTVLAACINERTAELADATVRIGDVDAHDRCGAGNADAAPSSTDEEAVDAVA